MFLTPPVKVVEWADRCEARWKPAKPFKYEHAPVLATNRGHGDFQLIERFAKDTDRTRVEGGLSSRVRNRTRPLEPELAAEVIRVYESMRASPADAAHRFCEHGRTNLATARRDGAERLPTTRRGARAKLPRRRIRSDPRSRLTSDGRLRNRCVAG